MNLSSGIDSCGDEVNESREFLRAVTLNHLADDLAGGDIESRHQTGRIFPRLILFDSAIENEASGSETVPEPARGRHRSHRIRPGTCPFDLRSSAYRKISRSVGKSCQTGSAVPFVIVSAGLAMATFYRQGHLRPPPVPGSASSRPPR